MLQRKLKIMLNFDAHLNHKEVGKQFSYEIFSKEHAASVISFPHYYFHHSMDLIKIVHTQTIANIFSVRLFPFQTILNAKPLAKPRNFRLFEINFLCKNRFACCKIATEIRYFPFFISSRCIVTLQWNYFESKDGRKREKSNINSINKGWC